MAIRNKRHSGTWSVVEAKAHLDEVIDEVEEGEWQTLVRIGDQRAAIVSVDGWEPHSWQEGTLAEFFHRSGLGDAELDLTRHPDPVADLRNIDV